MREGLMKGRLAVPGRISVKQWIIIGMLVLSAIAVVDTVLMFRSGLVHYGPPMHPVVRFEAEIRVAPDPAGESQGSD